MSHYDYTKSRVAQWLGIILIVGLFVGAYWYFQVRASTLNQSKNDLVTNGLVGLWSFNGDDISGTTAYDRSGQGNNGTLTNGPTITEGKVGQALNFFPGGADTNAYVNLGDPVSGALDFGSGDFSVGLWAKSTGYVNQGSSANLVLTKQVFNTGSHTAGYSFSMGSSMSFIIGNGTTAYTVTQTISTITDNKWHYYIGQRSGNTIYLYVDGSLVASTAVTGSVSTSTSLTVGGDTSGNRDVNGVLDEIRVYNRALSATEVQSIYALGQSDTINSSVSQPQGTGRLDSGLAGYWALDNGSGTSATDSSTNGNTGTLTNGPTWTTGQIGSAVTLDGTDDHIITGTGPAITNQTLSVWIKPTVVNSNRFIVQVGTGGARGYLVQFSDEIRWAHLGGSVYHDTTVANMVAGQWYHVVATYFPGTTNNVHIYVNGVDQTLSSASEPNTPGGTSVVTIGATSSGFSGTVDEARIYSRALSSDEAAQLYRLTAPTGVDTSLKGYWSFNGQDLSGTSAFDRSGAGNTGTLTNGPTKVEGKLGQALDFDGTDDYVTVADNAALDFGDTADLTLSGWFYRDTFTTDDTIVAKRNGITAGDTGYLVYIDDATDQLIFEVSDGVDEYSLTSTSIFASTGWNHYTIVWDQDSAANSEIYINGVANGATDSGTIGNIGDLSNAVVLATGSESDTGNPFDGKLDEIRVYNRAITASEIQSLYALGESDKINSSVSQPQGTGRLDSGLAGYWALDNGSGTSATDSSTNGNTGTLTNGPTWTTGQIGGAVTFDGTNDYITNPSFSWNANSPITVAFWNYSPGGTIGSVFTIGNSSGTNLIQAHAPYNDNILYWDYGGSSGNARIATSYANYLNQWTHVVLVNNGTNFKAIYLNGVLVNSGTSVATPPAAQTGVWLGTWLYNGTYHNGKMDDFRIYNRTLSADEVSQLYRLTAPTGVDTSLKGYWSFNGQDLSGTSAFDRSGAGNTGTLTNGPAVTEGKLGQALDFDGTDDYIALPAAFGDFGTTTDFTLSSWFRNTNAGADTDIIFSKDSGPNDWINFGLNSSHQAGLACYTGGATLYNEFSTATYNDNIWHHLVAVRSTSGTVVIIYVDGVAVKTTTSLTACTFTKNTYTNIGTYRIGFAHLFKGGIDEFRAYNRALSAAEIAALYNSGR